MPFGAEAPWRPYGAQWQKLIIAIMIIGLIGLPQVGKKTLFELITGHPASQHDLAAGKTIPGSAEIADPRFDWLSQLYQPKKNVRARINVLTEIPEQWREGLSRWSRQNRNFKIIVDGRPAPSEAAFEEVQSMVGRRKPFRVPCGQGGS